MTWKALLNLRDTNEKLQTQLSDLSLSPLIISILKINIFLHLNMFIDYPFKTKKIYHLWIINCWQSSSFITWFQWKEILQHNVFGQFLWCLRKDFIQCLQGTKETWKIGSAINFVINLLQSWENVVFRINTKETIDQHRRKYWTSFDIMNHWFSYYGISRNWNPPWRVQNDSTKSSKRKNLKKPLKKPSFSPNIVKAKINFFQDLTT